ncbi:MAG: protein kinase domain-containing protein [Acidobacteriota bacterium]
MSETISPNSTIAQYTIVSKIGEGGMGEVWRARDPKLGRDVAIKVLPASLSENADRLNRFEQEAQAAGALNHPNILVIYHIGTHDGAPYIVSELLEGETLRERMAGAAFPQRKAIDYGLQIAKGLAAAHEKGIVHRDIKPDNIFVTNDGRVKILDFGLAKLTGGADATQSQTEVPTRKVNTDPGTVMGTMGYMSPEQLKGQHADHRSDIFSFGAILYEMLSGKRAFRGDSMAETMSAILREDPPDLSETNKTVSPSLERVVRHCLEKNPAERFHSARDLAFAIESLSGSAIISGPTNLSLSNTATTEGRAGISRLVRNAPVGWIAAGVFALIALILAFVYLTSSTSVQPQAVRLSFEPPADLSMNDVQADAAVISPDGQKIAFSASASNSKFMLYVRDLNTGEVKMLPGSDLPLAPFWSPDSKSIAYGSLGKLKRSDIAVGNAQVLTDAPRLIAGAWNENGDIIFCPDYGAAMYQVSANGGEPKQITFQESTVDGQHSGGTFLPDGKHFLFTRSGPSADLRGVWLGSLDSKEIKRILNEITTVRFAPPDWLVMVRNQVLVAQKFDLSSFQLKGQPLPIITQTDNPGTGPARFSVSDNGVLVWQPEWKREYQLLWLDRTGKQIGTIGEPELVSSGQEPRLSPDGKHLALKKDGLWVTDLAGGNGIKLGVGQLATWSPDGSRIAYNGPNEGTRRGIVERAANGVGDPQLLLEGVVFPNGWTPDGRFLLYMQRAPKTRLDIWALPLFGDRQPFVLLNSRADEHTPMISANGRWIAYLSDESGYWELYVQSFTSDGKVGSDRQRISGNGATSPVWSRDGKEIFFIDRDRQLMATTVKTDGSAFEFTTPVALFKTRTVYQYGLFQEFDVSPDRQKFLIGTLIGDLRSANPTVIMNWTSLLKK